MSKEPNSFSPLAERIRPSNLNQFQGQRHLVSEGKPLRTMIDSDSLSSFILWGPPGTGKTTLAKIIANNTSSEFYQLNAVSSGVKDLRQVIERARQNLDHHLRTILFIDEIHRFNKAQQDALLASVESGEIILIGATTENPSFEVIPALRSRVRIFVLEELTQDDLKNIINTALKEDSKLKNYTYSEIDFDFLIFISGGDARTMLNVIDAVVDSQAKAEDVLISKEVIENIIQKKNILYDKAGEEHYNVISAFIKSVRGSDPDAALYWLARMIEGGEDPLFIARRLIILASEDIGNAAPNGLVLAEAAFSAVEKIGMPEGRIVLAQCTTYLASSPKSNASYVAIKKAQAFVNKNPLYKVPKHLRNAPTKLMKNLGYSDGYLYPHEFDNNFIEQNYLPDEIKGTKFFEPTDNGQEKKLKDYLKHFWKGKK